MQKKITDLLRPAIGWGPQEKGECHLHIALLENQIQPQGGWGDSKYLDFLHR
jgi:hypothetical protein